MVRKFCEKNHLFSEGDRVLVGLSGGADSVYLALVLSRLATEWGLELMLVHVDHGIRGAEADRDEQFCRAFADRHGLPVTVFCGNVPEMARQRGRSVEETAREYRYGCMQQLLKKEGYQKIAVAHHRDDQAETVLFQLVRGSGLRGMGGMRASSGNIVRPLLGLSHRDILSELEACGQDWCEDSTNASLDYSRNRIRRQILPLLEEYLNPAVSEHLSRNARQMQAVQDFLEDELAGRLGDLLVDECGEEQEGQDVIRVSVESFLEQPAAMQMELARWMIVRAAGKSRDIGTCHIEGLAALAEGESGKRLDLPYGVRAGRDYDILWVRKNVREDAPGKVASGAGREAGAMREDLPICWEPGRSEPMKIFLHTMEGKEIRIILHREAFREKFMHNGRKIPKNNCTKWFDHAKINGMLQFRHPLPGDHLWLEPEQKRRKPLNRLLIDLHIPREHRAHLWVLAEGSQIVWIPELGRVSADYYVSDRTEELLCADIV